MILLKPSLEEKSSSVRRITVAYFVERIAKSTGAFPRYAALLAVTAGLVWSVAANLGPLGAGAVVLLGIVFTLRQEADRRSIAIYLLASIVAVTAIDYLSWRFTTVNLAAWWVALPLYAAEAFGALHIMGLQFTVWPRPEPVLTKVEDPTWRPVYILIPTVDEGVAILEQTVRGAIAARERYLETNPQGDVEIVICNDGLVARFAEWQATEDLANRLGVTCFTRTVGGGAKAGNIEAARQHVGAVGSALIAIFDADQIPEPEFLVQTVPPFADPTIGWVQTGQYYRNVDNPVARWAGDQQQLFYQVLCPGKAALNSAFICGTNVVLRAAALDEIGGLPTESVTEDFLASIDLHSRWRSIFVGGVLARGLGPMDFRAYLGQQRRWATGTLGVLKTRWRRIFLPSRNGLSCAQRIQYALACTHYLCGLRDLVYILAPLVFLITGSSAVRGSDLPTFLEHFLPYWAASQLAFWYVVRGRTGLAGIVMGFASFPALLGALGTVIRGRPMRFLVTPKRLGSHRAVATMLPHLVALAACLGGLGLAATHGVNRAPIIVSTIWVAYSTLMLGAALWLGLSISALAPLRACGAAVARWTTSDRAPRRMGFSLFGLLSLTMIGTACLRVAPTFFSPPPAPFAPQRMDGRPVFGLSLPNELLATRPARLESQLHIPLAIEGRTQVIGDSFDARWANRLNATGVTPWITLLFGVPGSDALDTSLPAIANGLHDDGLRRWAAGIRDYGRPVYLTVLPHVDRNWSVSSAVTNGGIPQDAPRAWEHIQNIFQEAGARNIAWVWAPADPSNDQEYAPPASSIGAVLVSLISYPNTEWADPKTALTDVENQHPHVPVLLEVSAAGDASRKASWLEDAGRAVAAHPEVVALIYHEGSPDIHATLEDDAPWSMDSDGSVLDAFHQSLITAGVPLQPTGGKP